MSVTLYLTSKLCGLALGNVHLQHRIHGERPDFLENETIFAKHFCFLLFKTSHQELPERFLLKDHVRCQTVLLSQLPPQPQQLVPQLLLGTSQGVQPALNNGTKFKSPIKGN